MKAPQRLFVILTVLTLVGFAAGEAKADHLPTPPGISTAVNAIATHGIAPGPQGVGSVVSCPVLQQLGSTRACGCCGTTPDKNGQGPKRALEALANAPSFVSLQPVIDRIDAKHSSLRGVSVQAFFLLKRMGRFVFRFAMVIGLCVAAAASFAEASEQSKALVREGTNKLKAGDLAEALKLFRAAEQADPKDADALFLQGVVLNRTPRDLKSILENPNEAYQKLSRARELGSQNRDLSFEIGWSLLKLQRWAGAIEELEAYEKAHPGRAKTSEFLGRAYMEMGELDRAEKLFNEAIRRDPQVKPTVGVYKMELERRRGNPDKAVEQLRTLLNDSPDSPVSAALRDALGGLQLDDVTVEKAWRLTLTVAGGYNSNVVAVGDSIPLPADISARSSAFGHVSVDFAYDLARSEKESMTVGYFFTANEYESGVNSFDLFDHYLYGTYYRKLDPKWTFGFRLSDQYSILGGDSFRNQVGLRPSLLHRLDESWTAEIAYNHSIDNYMTPTATVSDRDGSSHTVIGSLGWDIPDTKMRLQAGVFYTLNDAEGPDYDYDRFGYFTGVHMPLAEKFDLDFIWTRTQDDYDNLNSFSGFSVVRSDRVDVLSARLTRGLDDRTSLFLQANWIDDDSNVTVFDYTQHVFMGGLIFKF